MTSAATPPLTRSAERLAVGALTLAGLAISLNVQVLAALGQSPSPFCAVVTRKAFGVAGAANHKPGSHHFRFAWPSGDWGSLPIEGGIEVAYKVELEQADDYDEHLTRIKERLNRVRSPFRSAEHFEIEEIIDPRETRPKLIRALHSLRNKRQTLPAKKHGNIPL